MYSKSKLALLSILALIGTTNSSFAFVDIPNIPLVPEPTTMISAAAMAAIVGVGIIRRRKK